MYYIRAKLDNKKNSLAVNENNLLIKMKHGLHPLPSRTHLKWSVVLSEGKIRLVPGACKRVGKETRGERAPKFARLLLFVFGIALRRPRRPGRGWRRCCQEEGRKSELGEKVKENKRIKGK